MSKPSAKPPEQIKDDGSGEPQDDTMSQTIEKSITGEDAPMEHEHPTSPGALIWFTYPALLILVLLIGLAVMAWWNATAQSVAP